MNNLFLKNLSERPCTLQPSSIVPLSKALEPHLLEAGCSLADLVPHPRPQSVCACVSARDLPKENISCIILLWSVIVLCLIFLSSVCSVHVEQECFSLLINQQYAAVCYCQQVLNDDYAISISSLRPWSVAHQKIHT